MSLSDFEVFQSLKDRASRPPVVTDDPVIAALDRLSRVAPAPWSIERHGPGMTLYSGRDDHRHGLNLVSLIEFDWNGKNLITFLEKAPEDVHALATEVLLLRQENASLRDAMRLPPRRPYSPRTG